MLDDHDQVWRGGGNKARFCAEPPGPRLMLAALALNLTTLGIPCLYYGSEQLFDGGGPRAGVDGDETGGGNGEGEEEAGGVKMEHHADQYIREAMFGGGFGPFGSRGRHAFDERAGGAGVHAAVAAVARVRVREPALRRGRQYLREILVVDAGDGDDGVGGDDDGDRNGDDDDDDDDDDGENDDVGKKAGAALGDEGQRARSERGREAADSADSTAAAAAAAWSFPAAAPGAPRMLSVVAWSRLFDGAEVVCAMNTDDVRERSAWVTVDAGLQRPGRCLDCLFFHPAADAAAPAQQQQRQRSPVRVQRFGDRSAVWLVVPPAGFVIYK
jgi:hypothetical protein